mmetsp:Transcript_34522/g.87668  ORF Transcript_34522/g.87668 Transcript_34522/m.87668 type:complete len:715 (+) Transcript_34522:72-2216(+)
MATSNASANDTAEQMKLVGTEEDIGEQLAGQPGVRRNRRLIFGGVLSAALAAGVVWKVFTPCVEVSGISKDSADSFVSLAQQIPQEDLDPLDGRRDDQARLEWIAAARQLSSIEAEDDTEEAKAHAHRTVKATMEVEDQAEASKIVKRAMVRAMAKSSEKHKTLKQLLTGQKKKKQGSEEKHFLTPGKRHETSERHESRESHGEKTKAGGGLFKHFRPTTAAPSEMANDDSEQHHRGMGQRRHGGGGKQEGKEGNHTSGWDKEDGEHLQKALFTMMSVSNMMSHMKGTTTTANPRDAWGEHVADCVFNVLSATNTFAATAANLNDAVKTCKYIKPMDIVHTENTAANVHAKVCSVNIFATLGGLVSLASTLSGAADYCASTLVPNVDAKCSQAITGLIQAVASGGGAFTLISAACREEGWYGDIPKDRFPHNVGSNEIYERDYFNKENNDDGDARRLSEAEDPAPPRQLLFGGGRGSTAVQCATEIGSVMWNLAYAALAINAAGNRNGPGCPPMNLFGEENPKVKGIVYEVSEGSCAVNIESAITSFLLVIAQLELIAVNCVDTLNVRAICGAGIDGIFAAAAGIAQAATGIWLACDTLQREPIKSLVTLARGIDINSGLITNAQTGNMGRRLSALQGFQMEGVEELKRRFATPEEAWMSLGYDLDNASAPFRQAGLSEVDVRALAELVSESPAAAEDKGIGGLFGSQSTCNSS